MFYKLLSFNVWFDPIYFEERNKAILDIIRIHKPDIICMQEVLSKSLIFFKENLEDYYFSIDTLNKRYGEVILSKNKLEKIKFTKFDSFMGRELQCATTILGDKHVRVGTFHLESVFHDPTPKVQQFRRSIKVLDHNNHAFLLGDTNITENDEVYFDLDSINPDWKDVWIELDRPRKSKFTYDSERNPFADEPFRNRLDRIYFKSNEFYPVSIKLVGTTPNNGIFPSDHFGLLAQFDI